MKKQKRAKMLSKPKKIIVIMAVLQNIQLLSVFDYVDTSLPQKSFLYAPHREAYILNQEKEKEESSQEECFFCSIKEEEQGGSQDLIKSFEFHNVILNGFPYNKGHLLISPKRHVGLLEDLTLEEKEDSDYIVILKDRRNVLYKKNYASGTCQKINMNNGKVIKEWSGIRNWPAV